MKSRHLSYKRKSLLRSDRCVLLVKLFLLFCCIGYVLLTRHVSNESTDHPSKKIIIWNNDFHISPIRDAKHQLASFNVHFIEKSLSSFCHMTKTCAKNLKILNPDNGIDLKANIRKQFYEAYKDDAEMKQVDAFICFHPTAMCELFMPFNKPIIVIATTRYELGRFSKEEWTAWNRNLQIIASNPRNFVGANNRYDAEYIRYFTGIKTIVLPSLCAYTETSYTPQDKKPFLIAQAHAKEFLPQFMSKLNDSIQRLKMPVTVGHLRDIYKEHYEYSQLATHPGIIYIPYQVSLMSLFEQYRMSIPLFFPSIDLLTEWHYTYRVVEERTFDGVFGKLKNASVISGVGNSDIPDPNNELDRKAIRYWLQFADFYQWPHIIYFNSTDDLATKLTTTNLKEVSQNMKIYNENVTTYLHEQWDQILHRIY